MYKWYPSCQEEVSGFHFVSRGVTLAYFYVFHIPTHLIEDRYNTVIYGCILLSLYKLIIYDEVEMFHEVQHKDGFGHFIIRNAQTYKTVQMFEK